MSDREAGTGLLLACCDCDLLHRLPETEEKTLLCARCGAVLHRPRPHCIDTSLALSLAALMLFLISNCFPFLAIEKGGFSQQTTLLSGAGELWREGLRGLSLLVLLTCVVVPLAQLSGLLYVLAPLKRGGKRAVGATFVFRLLQHVAPWSMMEVFMLGILVALVKLGAMATIVPGISLFSFGALILVMAAAVSNLDPLLIWRRLER